MSGHNKWSKIKHKKGAEDKRRSKIFSKIVKEITISIKEGGSSDSEFNPRLRVAISNAKGENMPKDNINRAIKKAEQGNAGDFLEPTYEGYAPHGIAVYVECTTDNLNRTVSHIRSIFSKYGGNLATNGSVDYLFERKGIFVLSNVDEDEQDELQLELIDAGAESFDYDSETEEMEITVGFTDFGNMQGKLDEMDIEPKKASKVRVPLNTMSLDLSETKQVLNLIEELDDNDDVQNVFHNLELTEEMEQSLMEEDV